MPAKLTVIVYILICFEVGVLLVILPWTLYWDDNFFLYFLSGKMHAQWFAEVVQSGYVRGAVTALGAVNICAGLVEAYRFRESVRRFATWESPSDEIGRNTNAETGAATADLADPRPRGPDGG